MIMLDICDMMEKDKLFFFLDSLSHDAAMKLQKRRVQKLANAVTVVERLSDYDVGFPNTMKSHGSASHFSGGSSGQSNKNSKSRSGGGSNGLAR